MNERLRERERKLLELNQALDAKAQRAEAAAASVMAEQEAYFSRMAQPPLLPPPPPPSSISTTTSSTSTTTRAARTPLKTAASPSRATVFAVSTPGSPSSSSPHHHHHPHHQEPQEEEEYALHSNAGQVSPQQVMGQVNLLTRELQAMQERLEMVMEDAVAKDRALAETEDELRAALEENKRLLRAQGSLKSAAGKAKRVADEARKRAAAHGQKVSELQAQLDRAVVSSRADASKASSADVRLNRALEEADRAKSALGEARVQAREVAAAHRKEIGELTAANKRLERQKNDLMAAFKKQIKLIDLLKRQKLHLEAAQSLSFTEAEFAKILSLGDLPT